MGIYITIKSLFHEFETSAGRVRALQDINLTIEPGEFISIIGPNGSGKSTLLKHVNGLLAPTRGEIRVGGLSTDDRDSLNHIRRNCGMVFQNPDNQIVATTVEEEVAFGLENLGYPPPVIRKKVDEVMAEAGITALAKKPPHHLSGGQKQKVAIAGVLAMEPRCLLLDEATSMLDPRGREDVMALVHRLHREKGITVVQATHFMEEAARSTRVIILGQGLIMVDGTPREVLSRPADLKRWGLEAPAAAYLAAKLRQAGVELPADIIETEDLVNCLCS